MMLMTVLRYVYSVIVGALGLGLLVGGAKLLSLGGSPWYLCTGLVLTACAVLLWRGDRRGAWLYCFVLAYTVAWSLWEVGLNGWALLPRLLVLVVLGLWLLTPFARRQITRGAPPLLEGQRGRLVRRVIGWGTTVTIIGIVSAGYLGADRPDAAPSSTEITALGSGPAADWRHYGNDSAGTRYSELDQVTPGNLSRLGQAWSFRTGDIGRPGQDFSFEATPLKVDRLLYFCTPTAQVHALDAATGRPVWHFDPRADLSGIAALTCRGVSYFWTGQSGGECAGRIYVTTPDARLWGLDAQTGRPCEGFGEHGAVDLRAGLGAVPQGMYGVTSPPVVTHGKLVIGSRVQDNVSTDMPSGVVRAFDATTGRLAWAWDVGRPDRGGAPEEGETYTRSTPNAWAPLVADDALGLVYIPTGNPSPDFVGMRRREFDERFGDSLVAVDVETGRTRWSFQVAHHDLWDNDLSAQPLLLDMPGPAGLRRAVVVGTKHGDIFVLDRETGVPIVPVEERPAPGPSSIGERLSPTQPASPIAVNPGPALLTEATMWGATPLDQMLCRIQFRKARYEGPYTPPGPGRASLVYPGMFGGIEWGGLSVDPVHGILIANPSAMPFMERLEPTAGPAGAGPARGPEGTVRGLRNIVGTGYAASYYAFLSPLKIPCLQPPWGKLYAIDLATRRVLWERPVGTARDTGPFGIPSHVPLLIGTPQVGGTVVTRAGLVFTAATLDRYLRAYDLHSGRELWRARLPAGGQATAMTYSIDGRQFIVVAAGGHGVLGTKTGDYVVAYSLQ